MYRCLSETFTGSHGERSVPMSFKDERGGHGMKAMKPKGKLKNCPICGRLFSDLGRGVCPSCFDQQEEKKNDAVRYAKEHPDATMEEISEVTGVHAFTLRRMVKEGRFVGTEAKLEYPCSKCGAPITEGKLCKACLSAFASEVDKVQQKYDMDHPKEAAVRKKREMDIHNRVAKKIQESMQIKLSKEREEEREQAREKQEQMIEMSRRLLDAGRALKTRKKIRRMFYLESKKNGE